MATNEMVAYERLQGMIQRGEVSERTVILAMYSLCGFANIGSIGIQIAGIGSLAPERRGDLVALAPRAMLAGAMASWSTGTIAGMLM
jgi:CNT family concentrative nucleoside transporter